MFTVFIRATVLIFKQLYLLYTTNAHTYQTNRTFHSTPHARLSLRTIMAASMSPSKIAPRSISAQHRWIICRLLILTLAQCRWVFYYFRGPLLLKIKFGRSRYRSFRRVRIQKHKRSARGLSLRVSKPTTTVFASVAKPVHRSLLLVVSY